MALVDRYANPNLAELVAIYRELPTAGRQLLILLAELLTLEQLKSRGLDKG